MGKGGAQGCLGCCKWRAWSAAQPRPVACLQELSALQLMHQSEKAARIRSISGTLYCGMRACANDVYRRQQNPFWQRPARPRRW